MAADIIESTIQDLVSTWMNGAKEEIRIGNVFDGDPRSSFLFAMGVLAEVNDRGRRAKSVSEFSRLWAIVAELEKWRKRTAFEMAIQHNIVIEMCDAVQVSLDYSQNIETKKKRDGSGSVYFLLNPKTGLVKIGWTVDVYSRSKTLESQSGVGLKLLGFIRADSMKAETEMHRRFKKLRVKGEWFSFKDELKSFISKNFP